VPHAPPIIKLLVMKSSVLACYLFPLRPKYPPHHTILEQPQPMFLPKLERPSFTPMQRNTHDRIVT